MTVTAQVDAGRLALLSAVLESDSALALDIATGMMSEGVGLAEFLFDVIAPLQREVGRRWADGDFRIAEEHAATETVETVVAMLAGSLSPATDGPRLVAVCAEGDSHALPVRLVATHLTAVGYRLSMLGATVPAADLGAYLSDDPPSAVVLGCALPTLLPGARASIAAAHDAGVPVLVGGRGFGRDARRATTLGADAWAANPLDIDRILSTWTPDIAAAEATSAGSRGDATTLVTHRMAVIDAATSSLSGHGDPIGPIRSDLETMMDAVIAAVITGDRTIVTDLAEWRDAVDAAGQSGYDGTSLLLALSDPVAEVHPDAVAMLQGRQRSSERHVE